MIKSITPKWFRFAFLISALIVSAASNAQVGTLAIDFENAELWRGGVHVSEPRQSGTGARKWEQHTQNKDVQYLQTPGDLSAFNVMSFWLHSSHANGATFIVIAESTREAGVFSYYSKQVKVDWVGWKQVELHFQSFNPSREPIGWHQINKIRFTASGWNQRPTDESVWVLDELTFRFSAAPYSPRFDSKVYAQAPERDEYLKNLRTGHPRLVLLDEDLPAMHRFVRDDPKGQAWYQKAKAKAQDLYDRPIRQHELPDGRRLLSISRDVVDRMYHWGFMYRMEGDRKWLDRAYQEMEAVVAFPDWNPAHYLDTAEMMHAIGIGYDWFYNGLTVEQRRVIREGLWQHGLRLSHASYMGLNAEGMQNWKYNTNNWNFVCNGGTAIAAMAVLDEMPEVGSDILHAAFHYIQIPLEHFEPDGAWWEGVGYWGYAMRYFVPYLRSLETSFGTDFGFVEAMKDTGFEKAGDFPVHLVSPLGGIFNFADSGTGNTTFEHSHLFYLANRFENPLYQFFQEQQSKGSLTDLLYHEPTGSKMDIDSLELDRYFQGTEVATMRSGWGDRDALYVGVKGGTNGIAHAHQDLGSFIFYGLGEKWIIDLGSERETYQSHRHHLPKSDFYRIREEGHNTLVFNPGKDYCQDPKGEAKIVRFESSPSDAFAVTDLSDVYRDHATSVQRGHRLFADRSALLVQDEFKTEQASDVWWFAHGAAGTKYEINESGTEVLMKRKGKACRAIIVSPKGARFSVMDAAPLPSSPNPEIQNPNEDMKKLAIHLDDVREATIAVMFVPMDEGEQAKAPGYDLAPLSKWQVNGP